MSTHDMLLKRSTTMTLLVNGLPPNQHVQKLQLILKGCSSDVFQASNITVAKFSSDTFSVVLRYCTAY